LGTDRQGGDAWRGGGNRSGGRAVVVGRLFCNRQGERRSGVLAMWPSSRSFRREHGGSLATVPVESLAVLSDHSGFPGRTP
jgi:hypothetical protein